MRNSFPTVSEEAISDWVGPRSFQLGRSYFEGGAVLDPRLQGHTLKASCQGSMLQPYRLWVACSTEGIEEAHCSCLVGGGGRCKHVGALLLAWLAQPDAFRAAEELDTNLERRSQSELIALIKQMLEVHPDLESLLEAALPEGDQNSALVNPDGYPRQVAHAFRSSGDGGHEAWDVSGDIDTALNSGDDFLAKLDYANAALVYRAVAQEVFGQFDMMYSDDEHLSIVVDRCVQGLGNCLAAGDGDTVIRETALRALFDIFRSDLDYGGYGLGEDAGALVLEHATGDEKRVMAGWVQTSMLAAKGQDAGYQRRVYGGFLLGLEADHLDDDAFLEIARATGRTGDLVDRLLTLGRLDEALAEAGGAGDSALLTLAEIFRAHDCGHRLEPLLAERIETTRDHGLIEWLKARHEERGELAEALTLAQQLLEQRPHLARYRDVRELSRRLGNWQALRAELLAEWAAARQYGLLTDVYLDEGEIDLALKSVRQHEQMVPYAGDRLLQVAQAASETRPQAAVELYLEQAERSIAARGRNQYQQACTYLAKVRDLYRRMSQEPAWSDLMAGFRERHRRLPALLDELSNAGL